MCSAPKQGQAVPAGVDLEKETVITGRVVDGSGQTVGIRLSQVQDLDPIVVADALGKTSTPGEFVAALAAIQQSASSDEDTDEDDPENEA